MRCLSLASLALAGAVLPLGEAMATEVSNDVAPIAAPPLLIEDATVDLTGPRIPLAVPGLAASQEAPALAGWDLARLDVTSPAAIAGAPMAAEGPPADTGAVPASALDAQQRTPFLGRPAPGLRWADHVPSDRAEVTGFFNQVGTITTESLIFLGYFGAQSGKKLFRETTGFHFHDEGWFGKNTTNLGIDKLTHAFDTYLIAEILHMRLHHTTHASEGDALTAAVLASTFMALNEISDGIEVDSGYSMQDIAMNLAGAGFSLLRNTVPGMREKVSFKIEIVPNSNIYSYRGQRHYEQQRYMISLKGSGFEELKRTPLRFLDLQVGYYGSEFMAKDREAGRGPNRHLFVGVGLNLGEIFFGRANRTAGRAAYTVLDYFQVPFTSIRYDTTGHFGTSGL